MAVKATASSLLFCELVKVNYCFPRAWAAVAAKSSEERDFSQASLGGNFAALLF